MHRYIPYLAKNAGFARIGEKVVHHQARKYGTTKFGLNRFVNGYLQLTDKSGKEKLRAHKHHHRHGDGQLRPCAVFLLQGLTVWLPTLRISISL